MPDTKHESDRVRKKTRSKREKPVKKNDEISGANSKEKAVPGGALEDDSVKIVSSDGDHNNLQHFSLEAPSVEVMRPKTPLNLTLKWLLNAFENSCTCHIWLSLEFLNNPLDFEMREFVCTCGAMGNNSVLERSDMESKFHDIIKPVGIWGERGDVHVSRKPVSTFISSSPYRIKMDEEWKARVQKKGRAAPPNPFKEKFGYTVSQQELMAAQASIAQHLAVSMASTGPARLLADMGFRNDELPEQELAAGAQGRAFHALRGKGVARDERQRNDKKLYPSAYTFDRRPLSATNRGSRVKSTDALVAMIQSMAVQPSDAMNSTLEVIEEDNQVVTFAEDLQKQPSPKGRKTATAQNAGLKFVPEEMLNPSKIWQVTPTSSKQLFDDVRKRNELEAEISSLFQRRQVGTAKHGKQKMSQEDLNAELRLRKQLSVSVDGAVMGMGGEIAHGYSNAVLSSSLGPLRFSSESGTNQISPVVGSFDPNSREHKQRLKYQHDRLAQQRRRARSFSRDGRRSRSPETEFLDAFVGNPQDPSSFQGGNLGTVSTFGSFDAGRGTGDVSSSMVGPGNDSAGPDPLYRIMQEESVARVAARRPKSRGADDGRALAVAAGAFNTSATYSDAGGVTRPLSSKRSSSRQHIHERLSRGVRTGLPTGSEAGFGYDTKTENNKLIHVSPKNGRQSPSGDDEGFVLEKPQLVRASELRTVGAFVQPPAAFWITGRVVYMLLVAYYQTFLTHHYGADSGKEEAAHEQQRSLVASVKVAPAPVNRKDLSSVADAALKSLTANPFSSAFIKKKEQPQEIVLNDGPHLAAEEAFGPKQVRVKQELLDESTLDISVDTDASTILDSEEVEIDAAKIIQHGDLNDAEYVQVLKLRSKLPKLWQEMRRQCAELSSLAGAAGAAGAGAGAQSGLDLSATEAVLDNFKWSMLQKLLHQMPNEVAAAMYYIEHGMRGDEEMDDPLEICDFDDGPSESRLNIFYSTFPKHLLPMLREAVRSSVFHPAHVGGTCPAGAPICSWARRVVAGIYRAKVQEAQMSLALPVPISNPVGRNGLLPPISVDSSNKAAKAGLTRQSFPSALISATRNNGLGPVGSVELIVPNSLSAAEQAGLQNSVSHHTVSTQSVMFDFDQSTYTAAGRLPSPGGGLAPSITVVAAVFETFRNLPTIGGDKEALGDVLFDDVMAVALQLARPFDRLDMVMIPSSDAKPYGSVMAYQKSAIAFYEKHINALSNSPSHRVVPFFNSTEQSDGLGDELELHRQNADILVMHSDDSLAADVADYGRRNLPHSGADSGRQMTNAVNLLKYALRRDVRATMVVVGIPGAVLPDSVDVKSHPGHRARPTQHRTASDLVKAPDLGGQISQILENFENVEILLETLSNRKTTFALTLAAPTHSRTHITNALNSRVMRKSVRSLENRSPSRFVVCITDSAASRAAFRLTLSLCKPCDVINVVHIATSPADAKTATLIEVYSRLGYNLFVQVIKPLPELLTSVHQQRLYLAQTILSTAASFKPTFLVLGAEDVDFAYAIDMLQECAASSALSIDDWGNEAGHISAAAGRHGDSSGPSIKMFLTASADYAVGSNDLTRFGPHSASGDNGWNGVAYNPTSSYDDSYDDVDDEFQREFSAFAAACRTPQQSPSPNSGTRKFSFRGHSRSRSPSPMPSSRSGRSSGRRSPSPLPSARTGRRSPPNSPSPTRTRGRPPVAGYPPRSGSIGAAGSFLHADEDLNLVEELARGKKLAQQKKLRLENLRKKREEWEIGLKKLGVDDTTGDGSIDKHDQGYIPHTRSLVEAILACGLSLIGNLELSESIETDDSNAKKAKGGSLDFSFIITAPPPQVGSAVDIDYNFDLVGEEEDEGDDYLANM